MGRMVVFRLSVQILTDYRVALFETLGFTVAGCLIDALFVAVYETANGLLESR